MSFKTLPNFNEEESQCSIECLAIWDCAGLNAISSSGLHINRINYKLLPFVKLVRLAIYNTFS